jgi:tetratricopeptide (TPR) repeat protein
MEVPLTSVSNLLTPEDSTERCTGRKRAQCEINFEHEKYPVDGYPPKLIAEAIGFTIAGRMLVHRKAADEAFSRGDFESADDKYLQALELVGPHGEATIRGSLLYSRAVAQISLKRIDEACACLQKAFATDESWTEPLLLSGFAKSMLQQNDSALRSFQHAMRVHKKKTLPLRVRLPNGVVLSSAYGQPPTERDPSAAEDLCIVEESALMRPYYAPYDSLPKGPKDWVAKESRSRRGAIFFMHKYTMETSWAPPWPTTVQFVSGASSLRVPHRDLQRAVLQVRKI